jgi:hypothetical protein
VDAASPCRRRCVLLGLTEDEGHRRCRLRVASLGSARRVGARGCPLPLHGATRHLSPRVVGLVPAFRPRTLSSLQRRPTKLRYRAGRRDMQPPTLDLFYRTLPFRGLLARGGRFRPIEVRPAVCRGLAAGTDGRAVPSEAQLRPVSRLLRGYPQSNCAECPIQGPPAGSGRGPPHLAAVQESHRLTTRNQALRTVRTACRPTLYPSWLPKVFTWLPCPWTAC